jgi:hypothetical protein
MGYFKNILTILFVVNACVSISQNKNITNVDTSYLRPKLMEHNLEVRFYRNGDPIHESKSLEEFYQTEMVVGKASYWVKLDGNNSHFFYNWWAIKDARNIAPIGFKVPSPHDFKLIDLEEFIGVHSIGYIDINEFVEDDGNSLLLWTNSKAKDSSNYADAFLYDKSSKISSYNFPMNCSAGLNVRCIEDIEVSIKDSIFEFKKLLPNEYSGLANKMLADVISLFKPNAPFTVSVQGDLNSSKEGIVKNSISSIVAIDGVLNDRKQSDLFNNLSRTISQFNTVPYYKGNILMAHSDFKLDFSRSTADLDDSWVFRFSGIKDENVQDQKSFDHAYQFGFKAKVITETVSVKEDYDIIYQQKTKQIEKFESPGVLNSFACILPGMGLSLINRDFNSNTKGESWRKVGKGFLITSISLGAVSFGSKLYSNMYYKRYQNDVFGVNAPSNYKNANISQKIFLSSLIGYGVLGVLDFTFTFSIGTKNQDVQNNLKGKLESGKKIMLY